MNAEQVEQETNLAAADATSDTLQRTNFMLAKADSEWLDTLAAEILDAGGGKVSRSEIVRAALAGVRELHASKAGLFGDLALIKSAAHIEVAIVLAARIGAGAHHKAMGTNGKH